MAAEPLRFARAVACSFPIIPTPKKQALESTDAPWPAGIEFHGPREYVELAQQYAATLAGRGHGALPVRLVNEPIRAGGYQLDFDRNGIRITGSNTEAIRHAMVSLAQIASEPTMPTGRIEDWPDLAVRGVHLNLQNCRRFGTDEAVRFIKTAAGFKLNTILVEYGGRFPFRSHGAIVAPDALSLEDVAHLSDVAAGHGIRLIPLQQSLAHLEYALGHDALAHLRERTDKQNLMCPADPESLALFKCLAAEIIEAHPDSDWFHLGGDEARKFGHCPRCADLVRKQGHGEVFGRYVGDAARWLLDRGKRPILWDDTLCAHPSAIDQLPKETIIMYWDYIAVADPTPVLIPRMSHAAGGPRVAHDWSWSVRPKRGRISDVQADVMRTYSKPARLKSALGEAYLREFSRCLGDGFPRWVRALPYLEYYQDRGHDVITAPTGMGNGDTRDGLPNFGRFEHNIRTHAARCKANGRALGMITTAWYNVPVEMLHHSLLLTAQCAW